MPLPENKGKKLAGWALLMFLVNRDTVYTTVLVDKLLEYPSVVKLFLVF
uniref:Putative LAGLIDADG homing endonuclease n=1 Tax=Caulerpa cupressoides TaxID=148945 RepID=A0A3G2SDD0_9CHLO|nr:putative LAGLIDADG homing endonuclease [Caulerpa cupressoides]